MSKNIILPVTVPAELRDKFKAATEANYTTMAQAVRDFMIEYVRNTPLPEPEPPKKTPRKRIKVPKAGE